MRIGFVLLGDLDGVSGGFIYDRMLVERLRARGNVAEDVREFPAAFEHCDVVIEDELCHAAVFAHNARLRRAGIPVVALVHNLASAEPRARVRRLGAAVEHRYLRTVDGLIAVCETTLRDARAPLVRDVPTVVAPAG